MKKLKLFRHRLKLGVKIICWVEIKETLHPHFIKTWERVVMSASIKAALIIRRFWRDDMANDMLYEIWIELPKKIKSSRSVRDYWPKAFPWVSRCMWQDFAWAIQIRWGVLSFVEDDGYEVEEFKSKVLNASHIDISGEIIETDKQLYYRTVWDELVFNI